jgi:hypothetical protein
MKLSQLLVLLLDLKYILKISEEQMSTNLKI